MANHAVWTAPGDEKEHVEIHVGDTVRVHYKLIEKEKVAGKAKREVKEEIRERTQPFEGIVIAIRGGSENCMVTIRHMGSAGIGVERIFSLVSPWIKKLTIVKRGKVRRAKLNYLRNRIGREATRIHEAKPQAVTG